MYDYTFIYMYILYDLRVQKRYRFSVHLGW